MSRKRTNDIMKRASPIVAMMLALAATSMGSRASAQGPALQTPRTTLIIFAEHRMNEGEWTALFAALQKDLSGDADAPQALTGSVDLIQGDTAVHGQFLDNAIPVYLQGDCTLMPRPRRVVEGPLGWVRRSHGHILPYIHLECTRMVDLLGPYALRMNLNRRNTVMGEAMARVILHEWIHIASQSSAHSTHGISKAQFSVNDLLADDQQFRPRGWKKQPGI
jgi:hypothetical protein